MIDIDLIFNGTQWQYQISTTFFICVILPLLYYCYKRYVSKSPNSYNKIEAPIKLNVSIPDEAKPHWKGKRLYSPTLRIPDEPNKIQSYCPATSQSLGVFPTTSKEEMDQQIKAAKVAQKQWAKSSFSLRRKLLRTLNRYILDHQEDIARVACRDSGKTKLDASMGEIMVTLEKINWIIANGEKTLRPSQRPGPSNLLIGMMKSGEVRYEPMGVVSAIVSWNYPFHNLMGPLIAALFTGNAIVIKCSEQVIWSSQWFVLLVRTILKSLNIPEDLVQLCCCFPEDAEHFTSHPGLDHITFIGSKPVAHKVVESASKQLTPCVVELGGKDAVVVLDDVKDLNALASVIMRGTFQSGGQNCIGVERVICLPKAYETLVEILSKRVGQLRLGSDIDQLDEIDMGAMISDNRFERFQELIEDAVSKGAKLIHGGKPYQHPNYPQGHYFEPTLLIDVDQTMKIFSEEVFGPCLTMVKASDLDTAVDLANATEYGLGNSIFGGNFGVCSQVADRLESGNVAINDFATFYVAQLPFGGIKKSGYGKFGGEEGLTGLCVTKSVVMDKPFFRMLGVATAIPPPLDYPIADGTKAWGFVRALNSAGYDNKIWTVIQSIKKLAQGG
ncbi:Meiotic Sister-Chromatid recombination aldehyde dehydrogenase [Yamadazyma tenuis]|uniref:Aldedh-domain-containing protein n=1 Tax=Candida tenuis (strain ATCC 10573 / BCRC 21748 / CBS 615 / JCM 9827 / NBRC 10315 / NRRL Y-1498 / VKM Y-70) TaxID=590646 RepID=G3B194_CANTC|nr:Aldedh-domain-containing protein [Yamadazyma tenuis ATCC 10573]EGV64912.1 Aldedh-domain-containing protein [Yamadazyma tenuis ATCC 10573]WEJ97707.1 Meiotic Sister-Chromatid recombination aldehyde dehydrogenase [Yamadazyma tenuis]